jgi:hypothetical protein
MTPSSSRSFSTHKAREGPTVSFKHAESPFQVVMEFYILRKTSPPYSVSIMEASSERALRSRLTLRCGGGVDVQKCAKVSS